MSLAPSVELLIVFRVLQALTACGAVVLMLGFVATTRRAGASARRTAAALNPEGLAAPGSAR